MIQKNHAFLLQSVGTHRDELPGMRGTVTNRINIGSLLANEKPVDGVVYHSGELISRIFQ
ncbi:hypothetical protein FNH22_21075 [Fulvivirga sp. M361]|uniref:hypothetical protein n=1 Tax=Fulvivirga sp. M361 TaxID=2594266 RepID=UPI00117A0BDC|nr:hypothetical protein [Fulvivirga sp. M361]TRX53007.1 hypothetical protein FNH22_21075 [Fulvivirga sp. M361]